MATWERDDILEEVQRQLPWDAVCDVFSGAGWWLVGLAGNPLEEPLPVKYLVKLRSCRGEPERRRPRLALGLEGQGGGMIVVEGAGMVLVAAVERETIWMPVDGGRGRVRPVAETGLGGEEDQELPLWAWYDGVHG